MLPVTPQKALHRRKAKSAFFFFFSSSRQVLFFIFLPSCFSCCRSLCRPGCTVARARAKENCNRNTSSTVYTFSYHLSFLRVTVCLLLPVLALPSLHYSCPTSFADRPSGSTFPSFSSAGTPSFISSQPLCTPSVAAPPHLRSCLSRRKPRSPHGPEEEEEEPRGLHGLGGTRANSPGNPSPPKKPSFSLLHLLLLLPSSQGLRPYYHLLLTLGLFFLFFLLSCLVESWLSYRQACR